MKASNKPGLVPGRAVPEVPGNRHEAGSTAMSALAVAPGWKASSVFPAAYWAPSLVLAALASGLMLFHGDQWLADRVYAWQGHTWRFRSAFLTEGLIHIVGRNLSTAAWVGVLVAWAVARLRPALVAWRTPLATLLVSTLLATLVVAWIKSWSNVDCPWDLTRYGGARDYVGLLSPRPAGMPHAACFPAGHASAGYSWLALYFFFLVTRPQWRWLGLAVGIALGLLFGIVQQVRGAHFISHDLWTAAICWASAVGGFLYFQRSSRARPAADIPPTRGTVGLAHGQPTQPPGAENAQ